METLILQPPRKIPRLLEKPTVEKKSPEPEAIFCNGGRNLLMIAESAYLPKENKLKPLGEDSHFICEEQQTIGVADGVGGWAKKGIDSGIYARELMENAAASVRDQWPSVDPKKVLTEAYLKTDAKGSSTACIITLKDNSLRAVNLGDSGFMVLRGGNVVYRSKIQQSYFNCPYQLGKSTDNIPAMAEEIVFEVEPGDVVVVATDGLFDNVFSVEIEAVMKASREEEHRTPGYVAWSLAAVARRLSRLDDFVSPFTVAAFDEGLDEDDYMGGKYDDVTVIVAYIY